VTRLGRSGLIAGCANAQSHRHSGSRRCRGRYSHRSFRSSQNTGKIRDIDMARLLTVCGLLCLGFGLVFSVGLSRVGW
jgi:hypothetical protein